MRAALWAWVGVPEKLSLCVALEVCVKGRKELRAGNLAVCPAKCCRGGRLELLPRPRLGG